MLPMPIKSVNLDPNQTDLAADFAAPALFRNAGWTVNDWMGSRLSPAFDGGSAHQVNCVASRTSTVEERLMGLDSRPLYNSPDSVDSPIFIQRVKIYSDKIVRYPFRYDDGARKQMPHNSMANLTRGLFKGYISTESGRVIRKRLEAWIKSVNINRDHAGKNFRPAHSHIVFATLTLPSSQCHDDNEIKRKILMPFIQKLKRNYGVGETFWAAEPTKSGNIHFHCLFDRYIDKDKLNDCWNVSTDALGYFSKYVSSTGETSAPSTRINVCPEDMSLVKYVMKYVSKQPQVRCSLKIVEGERIKRVSYWTRDELHGGAVEAQELGYELDDVNLEFSLGRCFRFYERRPIMGRSWGMSAGLVKLDVFSADATYRVLDLLTIAEHSPAVKIMKVDHAEIYLMNTYDFMMKYDIVLLQDYRRYYLRLYQRIYHKAEIEPVRVIPLVVPDAGVVVGEFIPRQLRMAV